MELDTVELIVKIEQHFNISFTNTEAEQLHAVNGLHLAILQKLHQKDLDNSVNLKKQSDEAVLKMLNDLIHDISGLNLEDIHSLSRLTYELGLD